MGINIREISDLLHIKPVSADIYMELLTHGGLSREQIGKLIDKPEKIIEEGIDELGEKGFIIGVEDTGKTEIFQALSMLQLEERLEREKEVLKNLKKFVLPQFQQPQKLEIMKYEGIEGIRKVYLEVLEEAKKTKEDILALESGIDVENLGAAFVDNYIKKRITNKIKAYVITPDASKDKEYKSNFEGNYTFIKLLPNFAIKANINIVGDLVMTFTLDPPQGTLRRNSAEAQTLKAVFYKLWEN